MSTTIANVIVPPAKVVLSFGEAMLKDVKPEWAARFAAPGGHAIKSNHLVFVFGHLSLYSSRIMGLLGQPEGITAKPEGWEALFKSGVQCQDDPKGTIYPKQDAVVKHYFDGTRAAIAALEKTDDSVLIKPNPVEGRFREIAPTIGAAVNFILTAHPMSHFGQVSAWRRGWGLGSAM